MRNGGKQISTIAAKNRFFLSSLRGEIRGEKLPLPAEKLGNAENHSSTRYLHWSTFPAPRETADHSRNVQIQTIIWLYLFKRDGRGTTWQNRNKYYRTEKILRDGRGETYYVSSVKQHGNKTLSNGKEGVRRCMALVKKKLISSFHSHCEVGRSGGGGFWKEKEQVWSH